jgi:hypothetical protein
MIYHSPFLLYSLVFVMYVSFKGNPTSTQHVESANRFAKTMSKPNAPRMFAKVETMKQALSLATFHSQSVGFWKTLFDDPPLVFLKAARLFRRVHIFMYKEKNGYKYFYLIKKVWKRTNITPILRSVFFHFVALLYNSKFTSIYVSSIMFRWLAMLRGLTRGEKMLEKTFPRWHIVVS